MTPDQDVRYFFPQGAPIERYDLRFLPPRLAGVGLVETMHGVPFALDGARWRVRLAAWFFESRAFCYRRGIDHLDAREAVEAITLAIDRAVPLLAASLELRAVFLAVLELTPDPIVGVEGVEGVRRWLAEVEL